MLHNKFIRFREERAARAYSLRAYERYKLSRSELAEGLKHMKKYKSAVLDMRRIKNSASGAVMLATAAFLCIACIRLSGAKPNLGAETVIKSSIPAVSAAVSEASDTITDIFGTPPDKSSESGSASGNADEAHSENIDSESHSASVDIRPVSLPRRIFEFITGFDSASNETLLAWEIPLLKAVSLSPLADLARGTAVEAYNPADADKGNGTPEPDVPEGNSHPIKAIDSGQGKALGSGKILIRNETDYGIAVNEMLSSELSLNMNVSGPKVLILHTHATESYTEEGADEYSADKSDRSLSAEENVIKIGRVISEELENAGIETIHDETLHDYPNFNGSYAASLKTAEKYKAQYPSIQAVFDIHRDAFIADDGSKAKFVTEINGKTAAQLMLVVGTDAGGLEHKGWRENMKLALKLQQYISAEYPNLMRGVNLRRERFNGHTTSGSLIIEVGASGNTLREAEYGARLAARKIGEYLASLKNN